MNELSELYVDQKLTKIALAKKTSDLNNLEIQFKNLSERNVN